MRFVRRDETSETLNERRGQLIGGNMSKLCVICYRQRSISHDSSRSRIAKEISSIPGKGQIAQSTYLLLWPVGKGVIKNHMDAIVPSRCLLLV